jgi:hypothetical protein
VVSFTPLPLYPRGKVPGTDWVRGWVDPRVALNDVEKRTFLTLPGLELRPLGRPARSQSLYRLRYPRSFRKDGNKSKLRTRRDQGQIQFAKLLAGTRFKTFCLPVYCLKAKNAVQYTELYLGTLFCMGITLGLSK